MSTDAPARPARPRGHLLLLAGNHLSSAMRSGSGLSFFLITLVTGLVIAQCILGPIQAIAHREAGNAGSPSSAAGPAEEQQRQKQVVSGIVEVARPVIVWALGGDNPQKEDGAEAPGSVPAAAHGRATAWTAYLLDRRPAALTAIYVIFLFVLPFLVPLGAFDQFAGDIGSRRLRYLLPRTTRLSVYAGRTLGSYVFTIATLGVTMATIGAYILSQMPIYEAGSVLTWTAYAWVKLSVAAMPFVTISAFLSAACSSSFGSLIAVSAVVSGIPLVAWIAALSTPALSALGWLLPFPFLIHLFDDRWPYLVAYTALCLGYGALYFLLGMHVFARRDV